MRYVTTAGETERQGLLTLHRERERHLTDKATFLVASLGAEECSNVATKLHCFRDASNHHGWAQHKSALFQICRKVPWLVRGLGSNVLPHHWWWIPLLASQKVTTKCLKAFDQESKGKFSDALPEIICPAFLKESWPPSPLVVDAIARSDAPDRSLVQPSTCRHVW